ncbi:MAG: PAS domain S-box protein, partial [Bacteroidota bacterium]|nr:PAS domain S-box protein [Bacteroidota bacterium]
MKDSLRKTTTPDNLPHQTEDLAESKPSTADRSQSETGTRGLIPENKAGQGRQELQQEVLAGSQPATSGTIDLSDYAPTGSFVLSREGTIVGLNLSGTKMLRQDSKILKGSLFGSFVSDDTKPVFNKFLREVYDDQVKATCEITLLSGQKTPTYVYLTGSLRNNKELCLIMAINITERRQNEERLQQERNLYLDIVNNQPAGIYRIRVFQPEKWWEKDWNSSKNPPYCMELASDRFCEILGITRKEFEATPAIIADLIHPDDLPEFSIKNEEANNLIIPFRWEGRLVIREKTSWVHLESIPRPLPTGEILWTGILYDITEQKKVEKALIESKNNYRELVDNSPDAICIYSEGEIVLVNNAYIRLMAATGAEDLIGIQIIETVHPHYRSLARERMHKAMTRLDIQPLVEEQLIRLDGTVVDIEVKAVPITFQDKQS